MSDLSEKKCGACTAETPLLSAKEIDLHQKAVPQWSWNYPCIERTFLFDNFIRALEFVVKIGALAEQENHHPDMAITKYRRVLISLTTHAAKGLTENDFIMAAKINKLIQENKVCPKQ